MVLTCSESLTTIFSMVRFAIKLICFVIPVLLIVFGVMDLSKAVTAQDEKATKEAQKRFISRCIYAVVIFLIPTIVTALFDLLPQNAAFNTTLRDGSTWTECWKAAGSDQKTE